MRLRSLVLTFALLLAAAFPAQAQWQVPSGSIPVGKGPGNTGFNTVGGSVGTGLKCLIDSSPPTFGACPLALIIGTTSISGGSPKGLLFTNTGNVLGQAPAPAAAGDITYYNGTTWATFTGNSGAIRCFQQSAAGVPSWVTCGTVTSVSITAGTGITQSGSPVTGSGSITVNVDKATAANLEAGAANKVLTADNIFDAEVTITFSATQTLDFSTFLNARITATANTTSLTCSNIKASQSGVITWVQDATGSRTMVAGWCSQFRWASGARGVLSTTANAVDALFYQCVSTSICYVSLSKAQAN